MPRILRPSSREAPWLPGPGGRGLAFLGPPSQSERVFLAVYRHPALHRQQSETISSLSVEEAHLLVLELWPKEGVDLAYDGLSGKRLMGAIFLLFLTPAHQCLLKEVYTLIWHLGFVTAAEVTPLDGLVLVASTAYACSPTGWQIFVNFKSCCQKIWLPIRLSVSTDWDPPLLDSDRQVLAHPQLWAVTKNKIDCLDITKVWEKRAGVGINSKVLSLTRGHSFKTWIKYTFFSSTHDNYPR